MAAVVAPFQSPIGGDLDRRNLMIDYAFSRYQYVITPREAEEIVNCSYWEDVDAFCSYMIAANFGAPIPGTKNVKLPSTLTLYTDEELDAMEAELSRPAANESSEAPEPDLLVDLIEEGDFEDEPQVDITQEDSELVEAEFDGEFLPPYTPDTLPPYSPYSPSDPTKPLSEVSPVVQVEIPEDDPPEYSAVVDALEDDAIMEDSVDAIQVISDIGSVKDALRNESVEEAETEVYSTSRLAVLGSLGSRLLQKAKRRLAHAVSPKTVIRVREIMKRPRQK
ncbi:hypothetical protein F4818DRAFT_457180 [Hypoxylon cercidicola]|nr:hypothetical protein F4818DRAFT_457180 [Hypoxylon cercidicola]